MRNGRNKMRDGRNTLRDARDGRNKDVTVITCLVTVVTLTEF